MRKIIISVLLFFFLIIINMLPELIKGFSFGDALAVSLGASAVSFPFGWGLYRIVLLIIRRYDIVDKKPKLIRFNYTMMGAIAYSIIRIILHSAGLW